MNDDDPTEPAGLRERMREQLTYQTAEIDQAKAAAADPEMVVPLLLAWAEFAGEAE